MLIHANLNKSDYGHTRFKSHFNTYSFSSPLSSFSLSCSLRFIELQNSSLLFLFLLLLLSFFSFFSFFLWKIRPSGCFFQVSLASAGSPPSCSFFLIWGVEHSDQPSISIRWNTNVKHLYSISTVDSAEREDSMYWVHTAHKQLYITAQ